jgi:glycosyltransferase involved in cell wall biosynthesis
MLSILIPTYNYNVYPLAKELYNQAVREKEVFEIIVLDDASNLYATENKQINDLENCRYLANAHNLGRASTINKLAVLSQFDYILILEADAFPSEINYIKSYLELLIKNPQAVFGGIVYSKIKPPQSVLLRWIFGNARESKSLNYRIANPFDIVFSWNLLIEKKLFLQHQFDTTITKYGFEDLVFLKNLKKSNITILQIENTLLHQNEESSTVFIEKSRTATFNLIELYEKKILSAKDSRLLNIFKKLNNLKLVGVMSHFFSCFENVMLENLLSEKPSLFLFDLFRLGYFCKHIQLKNRKK